MITGTTSTTIGLQESSNSEDWFYQNGGNNLMKPINIQIPDDLYDAVKNFAKEQNISMAEVVRSALRRYVYPEGAEQKTITLKDLAEQIQQLQKKIAEIEKKTTIQRHISIPQENRSAQPAQPRPEKEKKKTMPKPDNINKDVLAEKDTLPQSQRSLRTSKTGTYESLTIEVMKKKPKDIWTLRDIYSAIIEEYEEQLKAQGIVIKPESLKDRIARMVRNGTLKKVGRGKYVLP